MTDGAKDGRRRALFAGIFVLSLVTRVAAIDRPINVDEALWVARSASFFEAVLHGDLANTYRRPHPGVTTMWVIGLSNAAGCALPLAPAEPGAWRRCLHSLTVAFPPLSGFIAPRWVQAVLTAAAVTAFLALAARLFGVRVALPAAAILTFEPFFLAYQRFITPDALQVDLTGIGALLVLLHLREGGWRWLAAAATAFGLALAAKVPTAFVAPALAAWVAAAEGRAWPTMPARGLRRRAAEAAVGVLLVAGVVIAVWPALWVRPLATAQRFLMELGIESRENTLRPDDPRWSFYPRILAWRFSPLLHVGALVAVAALAWPAWRRRLRCRAELEALAVLVVSMVVVLRLAGGAASDRYLLPMIPPLALIAGAGWAEAGDWLVARFGRPWIGALLPGALALAQFACLAPHLPSGITFYNPLLGGTLAASRVWAIGQGEGLDAAGRWLAEEPGSATRKVASHLARAFAPYFDGTTVDLDSAIGEGRVNADRIVLYVREVQIEWPDPFVISYLWAQPPLHTVTMHGIDYVRIYRGPVVLPPLLAPGPAASPGP